MKTKVRKSTVAAVILLVLTFTSGLTAQTQQPTLSINPTVIKPPADKYEFFEARFSDGSPVVACNWTASGSGANGSKLSDDDRSWAVFFTGSRAGAIYTITAECKNLEGATRSASAYVFVQ